MSDSAKVTMKDISKALQVSSTAVHRALHGKEGVSEDLRKKILKAAEDMGYSLNYAASSIKRKKVRFAVILPSGDGYGTMYYAYFWKGYRRYLEEVKSLNIETEEYEVEGEEEQAAVLKRIGDAGLGQYQGVLTLSYTRQPEVMVQYIRLTAQKIMVVVLDDRLSGIDGLYCIPPYEKIAGKLCAQFLSLCIPQKGTILVCSGKLGSRVNENMSESFRLYLKEHRPDLKLEQTACYDSWNQEEERYREYCQRLESSPDLAGVFSLTSITNESLIRALTQTGLKNRLKVVGSDVYKKSADYLRKGLFDALIYKNPYQKGYLGMGMLVDGVVKNKTPQDGHLCGASLVLESSLPFYEDMIGR